MHQALSATLGEQVGTLALEATEEPLPSVLAPEGTVASTLRSLVAALGSGHGRLDVAGVRGSAASFLAAEIARGSKRPVLFVTGDVEAARRTAADIGFLLRGANEDSEDTGEGDVLVFVASENSPYADVNADRRAAMSRMATLAHLAEGRPFRVLVAAATALVRKGVPRSALRKRRLRVEAEGELDRDKLTVHLAEVGYLRVPVVEDPGTFAVRGALLDVWPPNLASPVRIDLYGDLVLSIKEFDPFLQRTKKGDDDAGLKEVWFAAVREVLLDADTVARAKRRVQQLTDMVDLPTTRARALLDDVVSGRSFFGAEGFLPAYYDELEPLTRYLPDDTVVLLDDPPSITQAVRDELARAEGHALQKAHEPSFLVSTFYRDEASVVADLAKRLVIALHRTPVIGGAGEGLVDFEIAKDPLELAAQGHEDLARAVKHARASKGRTAILAPLARRIAHWQQSGLRVFVAARVTTQAERLATLLRHQGVLCKARLSPFDPAWLAERSDTTQVVVGPLSHGVILPAEGLVVVTEEEVFGARVHRRAEKKASALSRPFVEDLRALQVGDHVVHVEHGVGKYLGLVHKEVAGLTVDLICVEYAGGDKLYLPVHRLNQLQKYSGGDAKTDRLGGSTFARTKAKVRKAVRQMADELLRLYAERQAQSGDVLEPTGDEYRAFEATFPFDETPDQARAIDDVNHDLETPRPMDRLVCGDVGFGKTEVALRAAFRVAMAGKQVAILCPTTVLAQQHYRTFEGRLRDYPVVVKVLSRFQSKKDSDETLAGIKDGRVDLVIATHRLLSKDVHFKNLGLLIVDEEQRFGVVHKERIKQLRAQVDVLTMSATPIPRTLQMAVTGLRDLSLIVTPPVDRRAVRTVVTRWDEQVVREAVARELARGGQVFYVYNRIDGLYERAQRLQALLPQARIAVAHGQMGRSPRDGEAGALEETMLDFVEGRYDILAATAIVESGLDIPRANTMIIDRADLFGLAQLYQLRGRVGRSKERAYCYLIVPDANAMTDDARSRIEALERHTELGSGFQIASLDLELRGAGDLLGAEQSGNVASVGFDLFCQMLDDAVHELRGEEVVHDVDPELSFDVTALLPESYVADVGVRLSLYKRLASAVDEAQVAELASEMEDRFGSPPEEARRLVQLMSLKPELRRWKVLVCEANARSVTLHLRDDTPLDPVKIRVLVQKPRSPYRLSPEMRLSCRFEEGDGLANTERLLVELAPYLRAEAT
jgi:transcription-repair coupling factor (superfamily II helicase)